MDEVVDLYGKILFIDDNLPLKMHKALSVIVNFWHVCSKLCLNCTIYGIPGYHTLIDIHNYSSLPASFQIESTKTSWLQFKGTIWRCLKIQKFLTFLLSWRKNDKRSTWKHNITSYNLFKKNQKLKLCTYTPYNYKYSWQIHN